MRKRSTNQPVEGRQLSDRQKDGTERKHTTHPEPGRGSNGYSTFSSAALRHLRFWSISLICSSISRQRLLVTVTGVAQARLWGGRKVKKDTARKQAAKRGGEGDFFQKMGRKHHHGHAMSCLGEGDTKEAQIHAHVSTAFVTQGPEGANRGALPVCPCPCPQVPQVKKRSRDRKSAEPLQVGGPFKGL